METRWKVILTIHLHNIPVECTQTTDINIYIRTHSLTHAHIRMRMHVQRWSSMERSMCQWHSYGKRSRKIDVCEYVCFYMIFVVIHTLNVCVCVCRIFFSHFFPFHFTFSNAHTRCCVVLYCALLCVLYWVRTHSIGKMLVKFVSSSCFHFSHRVFRLYIAFDFARLPSPEHASLWIISVHNFFRWKKKKYAERILCGLRWVAKTNRAELDVGEQQNSRVCENQTAAAATEAAAATKSNK